MVKECHAQEISRALSRCHQECGSNRRQEVERGQIGRVAPRKAGSTQKAQAGDRPGLNRYGVMQPVAEEADSGKKEKRSRGEVEAPGLSSEDDISRHCQKERGKEQGTGCSGMWCHGFLPLVLNVRVLCVTKVMDKKRDHCALRITFSSPFRWSWNALRPASVTRYEVWGFRLTNSFFTFT